MLIYLPVFLFLLQFTIHAQATQIGPAVAPRPLLSPARACWKLLLLLLPPRPKAPPTNPALLQTNRSAEEKQKKKAVVFHHINQPRTKYLIFNPPLRFSKATGVLSRDRGTTRGVSGITAVPTTKGTPAVPTTATRATAAALPVLLHSTLTTREVPLVPPRPPTTKTDPLITGCPKGLRGRTALDIGNAQSNPSTNPRTPFPLPPFHTRPPPSHLHHLHHHQLTRFNEE